MTRIIDADGQELQPDWVGILDHLDKEHQEEIAWQHDAACRTVVMGTAQERVHAFFPDRGKPAESAKAVCATCPVWSECIEYALKYHIRDGVWGGRTEKDRRVILRARRLGIPGCEPHELEPPQAPKPRLTQCCHGPGCDCSEWKRRLGTAA